MHFDRQIWSRSLWDIHQKFGRDKSAKKLYGDADAASVQAAFTARGIG